MSPRTVGDPPDGGWGWVVMIACFCSQFLSYGPPHAVGVLYPEWLSTFQESKGLTAWIGSVASGSGLITSPICCACVISLGARPVAALGGAVVAGGLIISAFAPNVPLLIFTYGVLVGIGCGLVYAAIVTITCQYFEKRRGFALGIVSTGTSLGGFLFAAGQNILIEIYGLEGCLLIVGALALNIIACAGLLRPLRPRGYLHKQKAAYQRTENPAISPSEMSSTIKETGQTTSAESTDLLATMETKDVDPPTAEERGPSVGWASLMALRQRAHSTFLHFRSGFTSGFASGFFRDRVFVTLCIAVFLFCLATFPPVLLMEDVALSEGLIDEVSAIPLVSIIAITTGVGKLVLGAMTDLRWVNSIYLYAFTLVGMGLAIQLIPVSKNYLALQVLSSVVGFFSGNWSISPYVVTKIVGIERLTEAFGILMFFGGFGYMLGPPAIGWFYDWTKSYDTAFYISGGSVILGGLMLFLLALPCWETKTSREASEPEIQRTSSGEKMASMA
ncbi:hypothetical protein GJAV_G00243200 [Gymnothorax javanicus]|nr:hypothetical protein GJAV_G00243200 [Gymnothorax javanicus]